MRILDHQLELDNMLLYVEIEFDVTPLVPATYIDPPEGGEVEISRVYVSLAVGETYEVYRREMGGWQEDLDRIATDWICEDPPMDQLYAQADLEE
ncbi:MAG: hypothetical protein DRQ40_09155 [Gammaproteobacteria bacterium]|nr:MAG: hypothetical protein DRQ40_09155 [Gammaproteobacteria bacterium]